MKRACKTSNNDRGFTMIEMVLVLIVMAILGTFIISRATTSDNELIAQTEILKSHLRHAQIKAMNETTVPCVPWGIRIPDAGSYILYRNNAVANDILPGEKPGTSPAPQTHMLPAMVTITGGVGTTYNFNVWGTPVDAGCDPIASAQTITLTQGTATSPITITKNTGYIP
jgi:prepilin-type N-terminal cleavage/methylation domain-containing protein